MTPHVTFLIPAYNATGTLARCVCSATRQQGITKRILILDHESTDGTAAIAAALAASHPDVELLALTRLPTDQRCPSRPLNEGIAAALRDAPAQPSRSWVLRLDADDVLAGDRVVADQLRAGGHRALVMATLVFFDELRRTAYDYGPRVRHRTLHALPGKDLYAVAHHATAMRLDLLAEVTAGGAGLYDERVETGEDLGATSTLVAALDGDESRFAFVSAPYCYKSLGDTTITGSLPLRRLWQSHRLLLAAHPEITRFAIVRGLAEAALTRVIGESLARRSLHYVAGANGDYRDWPYATVEARLRELGDDLPAHSTSDTKEQP